MRAKVRIPDLARLCAAGLAGGALLIHLGALAIYSMPDNPIRRALPAAVSYVTTFFRQDFARAAPDPMLDGLRLSVACTGAGGATTAWLDPRSAVPSHRVSALVDTVGADYARAFTQAYAAGCPDAPDGTAATNQLRCAEARLRDTPAAAEVMRLARRTCAHAGVDAPATIRLRLARFVPVSWDERARVTSRAWTPAEAFELEVGAR